MKAALGLIGVIIVAVGCWIMIAGCESTSSPDNVIAVTPPSVELDASNLLATFTVAASSNTTLVLPLQWSVSDASLGSILTSVGLTAVYTSSVATGVNTVIVRDQAEAEGIAVVSQQ